MRTVTQADYDAIIAQLPSLPLDRVQGIYDDTAAILMEAMTPDPRDTDLMKRCEVEITRRTQPSAPARNPNIRLATVDGATVDGP